MPTIKGFNYIKDEEGNATVTDGEGNPVDLPSPFISATPEETGKEKVEEKPEGINKLLRKPRKELDGMAEEKGLDPSDYQSKKEVAKAILEK